MLVEFIGSTGSGKTTLIHAVHDRLAKTTRVTTASKLTSGLLGLQRVQNPTAQNLIQELIGFPYFIRSYSRYKSFLACATRMASRGARPSITALNNLRSLERKIGVYEITRRYGQDWVVLVDEGPVLAVHMFGYSDQPVADRELLQFASLLPLPDLLVYVKAPVRTLMERTLKRADPPRELGHRDPARAERAVRNTVALFNQFVRAEQIRPCLLIVENANPQQQETAVDCIAESIGALQAVRK